MDNYCGKRLDGRYEIKEIIGVGGMAVVYKAYDNIDDRIVAIKILKQELLENEEFRRRFKNESKAIAVLSHPNIVKVYDVSFGDRLQYIVMEYIEGITLKEYIEQQGYINWKDAVHFLTQILRALQHAHDKGIIHRDIKPQNIMLLSNGTIKVTDFGIARFSRGDTKTLTESAIGSVHYISPEQAGEVTDDKADIYSVGVVLYEMLTGQLPFQSDSAVSVAIMQLQQEAKRPREINPEIPIGLEQITMRAMQKNTRDRYHSAAEMLMDIDQFKKNPSIKFDYSYFVDKEPTKYVGSQRGNNIPVSNKPVDDDGYDDSDNKKKILAIVGGIAAGLAVLALLFVLIFSLGSKVELPNFVGLNYNEDIFENEKYSDFEFEIQNVNDETKEVGTVIDQSPEQGAKVRKKSKVILKVAFNDENVLVDPVVGKTADEAKKILEEKGFVVSVVEVYDKLQTAGLVFKSVPNENSYAERGSTVTIYVATDESENSVKVPAVVGDSADLAKELIEKVGLVCKIEEVNDAENKDMVISQSPDGDALVEVGSTVTIKVSNGIPESSNATITFTLPKGVGASGTIKYYLNDNLYKTEKNILFSGKSKSIEVKGSGEDNSFVITINDKTVYECKIDFTKVPGVVSDVKETEYDDNEKELPDVTGLSKKAAKTKLEEAGFKNINFTTEASDEDSIDKVVSQSPAGGAGKKYPLDQMITVVIGTGPEEEPDTVENTEEDTTD